MPYGKVDSAFWSDDKIRSLTDDAKLLALYLLTGPHRNILGAMRLPLGYMSADLRWTPERCAIAIRDLERVNFICYDGSTDWLHIRNQLLYDPPHNPNQVKAAVRLAWEITSPTVQGSVRERSITHLGRYSLASAVQQFELLPDRSETVTEPFRNSDPYSGPNPKPIPAPNPIPAPSPASAALHNGNGADQNQSNRGSARPSPDGASAKVKPTARH